MSEQGGGDRGINLKKQQFLNRFKSPDRIGTNPELTKLDEIITSFPPGAKRYVAFLTSSMLEVDIYKKMMSNPNTVERMRAALVKKGVTEENANMVLGYFSKSIGVDKSV